MKQYCKFRLKIILSGIFSFVFIVTITQNVVANTARYNYFDKALTTVQDTLKPKPIDSLLINPSITIDTITLNVSKNSFDSKVEYKAQDSAVLLIKNRKIYLYGKTEVEYQDILLKAPTLEVNNTSQILTAYSKKDSLGYPVERVLFSQGETSFQSDTIQFNFKTQKGLTKNTYTEQGEMHVFGKNIKKIDSITMFVQNGVFTTCNLDEPHFAFRTNKMKVINGKFAISGPAHPEFEGVPIPIYIPFGIYPLSKKRHSGLLPASFARNEQFGLGFEGIGYYKVINDYFDVTLRGNVYSYGGYSFNITPSYRVNYRFDGRLNFSYQVTKGNFKGDPDFFKNKSFQINWNHAVDQKARPGTNFSANVSAGSSKYNTFVTNDPNRNFQNQLNSSIAYSKTWVGKPYNLTLSATHSQNNNSGLVNISLPDAAFTISTLYPFQKKELAGTPKWYEKLGIAYNGTFNNQVSFYDSLFKFRDLTDNLKWGARHFIPITLSLPAFGPFIVSPNVSYNEVWIDQKNRRSWNPLLNKVDDSITKGIFRDKNISFGIGINTAVFGTYQFKKSRIIALRHVLRPFISANFKPDLSKKYFYETQVNTMGDKVRFSELENQGSSMQQGVFGGVSFGIDNNLEMKWRSKKDTGDLKIKKIKLIDGFGFNGAYNLMIDSFKLSVMSLNLRSTLFEKINITASANLDPYQTNSRGFRVDKYAWQDGKFKLGTITNGSISMSTDFKSKPKDPKKEEAKKKQMEDQLNNDPSLARDQQQLMDYMRRNPGEFVDFNIPWAISISYSLNFVRQFKSDYSGFETNINSNIIFNNSFSLAPKWNFNTNGAFDFNTKKLQTFQMSISREMHCWQMSIGVTPIGLHRSFNISISPKSGILQDLKINRSRTFSNF